HRDLLAAVFPERNHKCARMTTACCVSSVGAYRWKAAGCAHPPSLVVCFISQQRRRKGSGDLPGLQSRRFDSSRVESWIRLTHASAIYSRLSYLEAFCVK